MVVRFGIAGTGLIAQDFAQAIGLSSSSKLKIVAVAARDASRAAEFAKRFSIAQSYASYQHLANDPQVDIVYIATTNQTHYQLIQLMLGSDKNVLAEKPMCLSVEQTAQCVKLARSKKLFLMEALWSSFFPAYRRLRCQLDLLGRIRLVQASFCIGAPGVKRLAEKQLGGGAILDVGIYLIHLATMLMRGKRPTRIVAIGERNDEGVDVVAALTLQYDDGALMQLCTATTVAGTNECTIMGEQGLVQVGRESVSI